MSAKVRFYRARDWRASPLHRVFSINTALGYRATAALVMIRISKSNPGDLIIRYL